MMKTKALCLALALLLLLACLPLGAGAEALSPQPVYISTAEEFLAFADQCRLDDWSRGRTVILREDINLMGTGFAGVPSFSGTFLGDRHTVSGLSLTHGEGAAGLFRYLNPGGRVENLTVSGLVKSTNSADYVGGIVGVNAGTVSGCAFEGTLKALGTAGGIVGVNGETGTIELCENSGIVISGSTVGGIAGQNHGLIDDCRNRGEVNGDSSWVDGTQEDESGSLLSGLTGGRDIGGIAGRSSGMIADCHNTGLVGYRQSGQNVGGIVGSMSGTLTHCSNDGQVRGQQSVGGIAGHLEPELVLEGNEDIRREVETLHDILDRTVRDLDSLTDSLHTDINGLLTTTGAISDTTKSLTDELVAVINGNLEAVNGLSDRVGYIIRHLPGVLEQGDNALTGLRNINSDIDGLLKDFDILEQIECDPEDRAALEEARARLEAARSDLNQSRETVQALVEDIRAILTEGDLCPSRLERLAKDGKALCAALSQAGDALSRIRESTLALTRVLAPYLARLPGEIAGRLEDISRHLDETLVSLQGAVREVNAILGYLGGLDQLKTVQFSEEFTRNGDALSGQIHTLLDNLRLLNDHLEFRSDRLEQDLRAINDQLNKVLGLILDRLDELESRTEGLTLWEDGSDREPDRETASRITGARNSGRVEGGTAVGGIAGSVRPEIRELLGEKPAITRKYQAYALVEQCENSGFVTVKAERGGGIVGDLSMGLARSCLSAGSVSGTEADYLGGIAGYSEGTLRGCGSLTQLRGHRFLGGIAGAAGAVHSCLSMSAIPEYHSRIGAIAGADLPPEGEDETQARATLRERMTGNRYVSSSLSGIDGISYLGTAEPVSYEGLLAEGNLPAAFTHLEVVFVDEEGQVLRRVELPYGSDLSDLEYPQLALGENRYADWEQPPTATLESSLILRAGAAANVTILPSREKLLGKALALAEGVFTQEALLRAETVQLTPPADLPGGTSVHIRSLTLENTGLTDSSALRVRLLQEDSGTAVVYALREGEWEELPSEAAGQYLEVEMTGTEQVFCIVTRPEGRRWKALLPLVGGGAAALAVLLAVFLRKKRSAKNNTK